MTARSKVIRAVLILVTIVAVPVLYMMFKGKPAALPPITLAAGERVYLQGVTFGTNHVQPGMPGWLRPLPVGLRDWVAGRLPRNRGAGWKTATTSTPTLKLWLEILPGTLTNNVSQGGYQSIRFVLCAGGIIAGDRREVPFSSPENRFETTLDFDIIPRRSQKLQLLCLPGAYEATNVLGRWEVKNPALTRSPAWDPDPLPATRQEKEVACTLDRVVFGIGRSASHVSEPGGGRRLEWPVSRIGFEGTAGLALSFKQVRPRIPGPLPV